MKYFLFLFLFLSVGWLHCRSQRVAVSVNALPAIDGAFEAGVSYAIRNKSTVELTGSLRPWKREEKYVNRYWLIQPEYKYWTCQKFNGFLLSVRVAAYFARKLHVFKHAPLLQKIELLENHRNFSADNAQPFFVCLRQVLAVYYHAARSGFFEEVHTPDESAFPRAR